MKYGLGFIIYNDKGEIFIVEELKNKASLHKKSGDCSLPMETLEIGESPEVNGLAWKRTKDQEVGNNIKFGANHHLGDFIVTGDPENAEVSIYAVEYLGGDFNPSDTEDIKPLKFLDPSTLLNGMVNLRHGVRQMIEAFLKWYEKKR